MASHLKLISATMLFVIFNVAYSQIPSRSDQHAVAVLQGALTALSGSSSWSAIKAVHLSGKMSVPYEKEPIEIPFVWEDKWEGRKVWYLHKMGSGTSERDLVQSPSEGRSLRKEDKSIVPIGEVATLPPFQIPGATLSVVLMDTKCEVHSLGTSKDGLSDKILVNCAPPDSGGGEERQLWLISQSTHLPISVSVTLENMRRAGNRSIETVHFSHFLTIDGLQIPDVCIVNQSGSVHTVTVESVKFPNPSQFASSDFKARP